MKKILNKLLGLINVHPDKNQKWLLISLFFSGFLITYSHPTLLKAIISELPAEWLAFQSMVTSIASLFIGVLWQEKVRAVAIKYFAVLAIIESICGFFLGLYLCFVEFNAWVYAIASLIYSTLITFFVAKCVMAFKAVLWIEKEREIYDNNSSIISGLVCIAGYAVALLALPSLKLSLFLWAMCCIIDDIGWIIVYNKNKEILKNC